MDDQQVGPPGDAERGYTVDWRFISLRQVNADVDYDSHFPPQYAAGHTAGLRLLRVAAAARATHGRACVGPLYAAMGRRLFEVEPPATEHDDEGSNHRGTSTFVAPILAEAGLPRSLVEALDDDSWDLEIRAETDEALLLTGKDVGTPIIHFEPPDGVAFFGPVISRLPEREDAVALWDHILGLTRFPGFAELKRSLREVPQLRGLGVADGQVGAVEEWHAGHRRTQR